jgi:hypothetical protein
MKPDRDGGLCPLAGFGLVLAAALASSGCYKATFVEDPSDLDREPTHEETTDHFVFGVIGEHDYDASKVCPNGASVVRTGGNGVTGLATVATLGIYSPRKVYVTCAEKRPSSRQTASNQPLVTSPNPTVIR